MEVAGFLKGGAQLARASGGWLSCYKIWTNDNGSHSYYQVCVVFLHRSALSGTASGALCVPATAQYLEQIDAGLQAREAQLDELILGREEAALGVEQGPQGIAALLVAQLGEAQRARGLVADLALGVLLDAHALGPAEGIVNLLERGEHGLAPVLHQHAALRLAGRDLAAQAAAVEQGLHQRHRETGGIDRAAEAEEAELGARHHARQADLQLQREEGGAGHGDVGIGRSQAGLGGGQIGAPQEQLGRQYGGHSGQRQAVQRLPGNGEALRHLAEQPEPVAAPAGITPATQAERAARGRVLFQTRGCLACHSHAEFTDADRFRDPNELAAEPDLSNLADKLTGGGARNWLTDFIRRPAQYLPGTVMPDLLLDPISHRDTAGEVVSVTDPAEDIVEFLLQHSAAGYQPQPLPDIDAAALDQLTLEYLRGAFQESKAKEYVEHGIPADLADTLQVAERELLVPESGDGRCEELSAVQRLRYVGHKSITKYGCYGCHDIPGFEATKPIGPPLSDWGRKPPKLLAFEHITDYLSARDGGPSPAGDPAQATREAAESAAYFRQQLVAGTRIGFTYQKLVEPRSYDYHVAERKAYHDRLRMPQFPFASEDREAVMTYLLGLVTQRPAEKYAYVPDNRRAAILEGQDLLDHYRCAACHVVEPQKWHVAYQPDSFRPQHEKEVFPWVDYQFDDADLRASGEADARGLLHATLVGMPILADSGWPLVFDEEGDELFEGEDYLPQTLEYPFQLWRPVALDGRGYQVGRGPLTVLGEQIVARQRSRGGFLTQYLLPHVTRLEQAVNPSAKGSEAWAWLPPPLLGQGARVQSGWLYDYLLAPEVIRPASLMRMPQYHLPPADAETLVNYFAALDRVEYPYQTVDRRNRTYLEQAQAAYQRQRGDVAPPEPGAPVAPAEPDRLAAAMRIVTDKTYCITCHVVGDFDPRTSDRAKGPDLADVHKRFRPGYLRHWLAEPASVLPYTAMPAFAPYQSAAPHLGGVAQSLYPGTSIEQLDALVDLLMNFDVYTRRRAPIGPLVEPAGTPSTANEQAAAKQ